MSQTEPTLGPHEPAPPPDAKAVLRRLGPVAVLAVIASTLPVLGGFAVLGSAVLYADQIQMWIANHPWPALALYVACFILLSGLALLPTYAQALFGGWAFGFGAALPAALAGFLGGSVLGYAVAAHAAGDRVERLIEENPKWRAVRNALVGNEPGVEHGADFWKALGIIALLRLPLNSPFALTNLVMASVQVPRVPFVLGTLIGMAPRTAAAVYFAAGLRTLSFEQSPWMAGASIASVVLVVVVIGAVANRALARVTKATP